MCPLVYLALLLADIVLGAWLIVKVKLGSS